MLWSERAVTKPSSRRTLKARFWLLLAAGTRLESYSGSRLGNAKPGFFSRPVDAIIGLALLSLMSACGFHLRGAASLPLQTIFIEQTAAPTASADIARAIRTGTSTRVIEDRAAAQAILQLSNEATEKRILSLNEAGRVRAFELFYRVTFRLHDGKEKDLLPLQQIELRRDFTYNDQQILAKEAEESLLYANMRSDAVQQIIRRISAVKPEGL